MRKKEDLYNEYLNSAVTFIIGKYDDENVTDLLSKMTIDDIHWSSTCRFAKFRHRGYQNFKRQGSPKYRRGNRDKPIRIQLKRNVWKTYDMKTVGVTATYIKCSDKKCIETQLVHELTHMVQKIQDRKMGEVETTSNEIEYVKKTFPSLAKKLTPVE